jgi:ammonium transporter, Amt family
MRARQVADRFCAAVSSRFSCSSLAAVSLVILATATCRADDTGPTLDGGDTAWMIVATALVLFMTLPGLSLFYGGLITCLLVGARRGFPKEPMRPHNLPLAVMGTGMLWVGWFGFNAGSALAANGTAAMPRLVTHLGAAAAATTWMAIELVTHKKASALGVATGAVAGLVAITPASGTAGPLGAIALGSISAIVCYWAATSLKHRFRYDDSLDVFGVHGVGGIVGAVLTGVVAAPALGGSGLAHESIASQVWWQTASVLVTAAWSGGVSVVAFLLVDRLVGMRASREVEQMGLDLSEHQEQAYEIV